MIPVATDLMISEVIPFADASQLVLLTVPMLAAACGAAAFTYLRAVAVVRIETRSDTALQSATWDHLLRLPAAFFRNHTAGDLADRAMGVSNMRQIITDVTLNAALAGIFSLVNILLIFAYDTRLAVVAILVTLAGAVPIVLCARTQLTQIRIFFRLRGRLNGIVLQFLRGIGKLRACHAERRAFALWADQFAVQQRAAVLGGAAATVGQTVGAGLPALAAIALFATVAYASPNLAVGSFVAVTSAFAQFLMATVAVIATIGNSLAIVPLYERLKPILNATPETAETGEDPGMLGGRINVEHVSFGYAKDSALASGRLATRGSGRVHRHRRRVRLGEIDPAPAATRFRAAGRRQCTLRRSRSGPVGHAGRPSPVGRHRSGCGATARKHICQHCRLSQFDAGRRLEGRKDGRHRARHSRHADGACRPSSAKA